MMCIYVWKPSHVTFIMYGMGHNIGGYTLKVLGSRLGIDFINEELILNSGMHFRPSTVIDLVAK
jgi:hypothetical protein